MTQRKAIITMIGVISLCLLGGLTLWLFRQNPDKPAPKLVQELNQVLSLETPTTDQLKDTVPMVVIPAGEFIMGSQTDNVARWHYYISLHPNPYRQSYEYVKDEWPQMTIYLDTFEIDQYEVTYERYQRCVADNVCSPLKQFDERDTVYQKFHNAAYPDYPVLVTHETAQTYCDWTDKRLPHETEWEKAARGTDGRIYPWGNKYQPELAENFLCPPSSKTVGQNPHDVSPYGVFGMMSGNPEWLGDLYETYPHSLYAQKNGSWPHSELFEPTDTLLTYRGDWCVSEPDNLFYRLANRHATTNDPNINLGFRCARGPEPPPLAEAMVSVDIPAQPTPLTEVDLNQMVEVPAGEFLMGSDEYEKSPLRTVYVETFYIDRYETTNREYAEFLTALGHNHFACQQVACQNEFNVNELNNIYKDGDVYKPGRDRANYPAERITWPGADTYCRWRGKRLPTNIEWEKAARGTDGRIYPWGNEWLSIPRLNGFPVGSHSADVSPYDVWDMFGSVQEWVADVAPDNEDHRLSRSGTGFEIFYYYSGIYDKGHGVRCAYTP